MIKYFCDLCNKEMSQGDMEALKGKINNKVFWEVVVMERSEMGGSRTNFSNHYCHDCIRLLVAETGNK